MIMRIRMPFLLFIAAAAASYQVSAEEADLLSGGLVTESRDSFMAGADQKYEKMFSEAFPDMVYEKEHSLMRRVLETKYQTSAAQVIFRDELLKNPGSQTDRSANIENALRKLIPGTEAARLRNLTEKGITAFRAGQTDSNIFSSDEYTGADGSVKFLMQQLFRIGAASEGHLERTEAKYEQNLTEAAEGYALAIGLTKAQSIFFAAAAREAAAGTELSPLDDAAWPEHLRELRDGIREEFIQRHGGRGINELERQYLRKSAALILNAALAGDQSSTMLNDIAAINLLTKPL